MKKIHMKKRAFFLITCFSISALILWQIFIKPAFNYLSGYLSRSEQVKANILVVEGWLPENALKLAYEEYKRNGYEFIITTGLKLEPSYFKIYSRGFLIFYLKNRFSDIRESGTHTIEVDALSELEGIHRAHINVFINDSLRGDFFAEKRKKILSVNWYGCLKDIDSVMVEFTNDHWGDFGDCNLFVKEIIIDHKITIPYQKNTVFDVYELGGNDRIFNNYDSKAELAKNQLFLLGIDSSIIKAVPGKRARINRTLTSALALRDWLKTSKIDIEGINIISMGTHARRTWMTYNRVLNEKYKIGIISMPDLLENHSAQNKILKTVRETLGIIYYWFILIPY
jgi:hypothetical protein